MQYAERYYLKYAAAFVRGKLPGTRAFSDRSLEMLSEKELESIFVFGQEQGLQLHRYKKTMGLPRVEKVLGILKGLHPEKMLDVGTGRGVFLYPFLENFPQTDLTCADILDFRVADLDALRLGGIERLSAVQSQVEELDFPDNHFEITTALEVLEHIPNLEATLDNLIRMTEKYIIISVPSKEDDNPEHIHLLTENVFKNYFNKRDISNLKFSYVLNHLILVVKLS